MRAVLLCAGAALAAAHCNVRNTVDWRELGRSDPLAELPQTLSFALRQRNLDRLRDVVSKVSDVGHDEYGRYLDLDELAALVAPPRADLQAVLRTLREALPSSRALTVGRTRDVVSVHGARVSEVEALLGARLVHYEHKGSGLHVHRALGGGGGGGTAGYTLPRSLRRTVEVVSALDHMPAGSFLRGQRRLKEQKHANRRSAKGGAAAGPKTSGSKGRQNPSAADVAAATTAPATAAAAAATAAAAAPAAASPAWPHDCEGNHLAGMITPAVLRLRYNATAPPTMGGANVSTNAMAIAWFGRGEDGDYDEADLHAFNRKCGANADVNALVTHVVGGHDAGANCTDPGQCGEGTLDIQVMTLATSASSSSTYSSTRSTIPHVSTFAIYISR